MAAKSITLTPQLSERGYFRRWILITFDNVHEVGAVMRYIIHLSRGEVSDLLPLILPAEALWRSIHSPNLSTTFHILILIISEQVSSWPTMNDLLVISPDLAWSLTSTRRKTANYYYTKNWLECRNYQVFAVLCSAITVIIGPIKL